MADQAVQVEGLDELRRAIKRIGDKDLARALQKANKAVAERVVRAALPHVPVRTGALRRSVKALAGQNSARALTGLVYSAAVHWGTGPRPGLKGPHNIRRTPFLFDAAQRELGEIEATYLEEVDKVLEAVRAR